MPCHMDGNTTSAAKFHEAEPLPFCLFAVRDVASFPACASNATQSRSDTAAIVPPFFASCPQQPREHPRVLYGMPIPVVVEVGPHASGTGRANFRDPFRELLAGVIVPIPALRAVKTDIHIVCTFHHLVRQSWAAARTKDHTGRAKRGKHRSSPPATMPKLDDIPP